jgi:hypothetical protein
MWIAGMHWSFAARAWCGLAKVQPDGRVHVRHELTFVREAPEEAAVKILTFCRKQQITLGYTVAQPSLWSKSEERGEHIAETFGRAGLPLRRGNDNRIVGSCAHGCGSTPTRSCHRRY